MSAKRQVSKPKNKSHNAKVVVDTVHQTLTE
jgi:hypothetical protein